MTQPDIPEQEPTSQISGETETMKQKLLQLQEHVISLETELDGLRNKRKKPGKETWLVRFKILIILILAAIPPALVVSNQWLKILNSDWNREEWCRVDFFCKTIFPSYFLVILWCVFALMIFLFLWRRDTVVVIETTLSEFTGFQVDPQQMRTGLYVLLASAVGMLGVIIISLVNRKWPGWDLVLVWLLYLAGWALRAIPLGYIADAWKKNGEFWVSLLITHVALVAVLAGYYDVTQIFFLAIILLVLALGNLWRFRERVPALFWIISITLIFYLININAWWTSVIGDDYGFHDLASEFVEKMSFSQVGEMLFKADGVNGTHPYFSSFVQAISMKLLGSDSFGWRFSSLYLCAMGVGLFYLFCKSFIPKRTALIAACLLAFSHYVMSFGKIGYNNLQALFALSLVLAVATWALRWKNPVVFALLGSSIALCFYLYPAALYAVPVPILLLLMYYPPVSRKAASHWLVMVIAWSAMIFPLLIQPVYWTTKVDGTIFYQPSLLQSSGTILQHFAQNLFYSIFSFLYISESHYIAVSYIDPITAIFILIGFFVLLYQMRRKRFAIFTALIFVFFLFFVGASHDRETPPNTRMFLMIPWFALMGSWGIVWLEENVKKISFPQVDSNVRLVPILLVAIVGINLFQAYKLSYDRYSGIQSAENLFVGMTQDILKAEPKRTKNIAVIIGDVWGTAGFVEFQNVYPHLAWFHMYQVRITEPVLPADRMDLFSDRDTLIIVSPYLDQSWQNDLDTPLLALGKVRCDVLNPAGEHRFILYYAPDMPDACPTY